MPCEIYCELNDCLVLAEPESPKDLAIQPPMPTCGNCQHFVQTEWYRSVFEGKTGYCAQVHQNRRKADTCLKHQFIDEF
jgi:hypothetical protein